MWAKSVKIAQTRSGGAAIVTVVSMRCSAMPASLLRTGRPAKPKLPPSVPVCASATADFGYIRIDGSE
jgi:hypothetical protein